MVWVHTHGLLCHQCENGNGKLKLYQNVILLGLVYIYSYKIVYIIRYILCYFLFFSCFFTRFSKGLCNTILFPLKSFYLYNVYY